MKYNKVKVFLNSIQKQPLLNPRQVIATWPAYQTMPKTRNFQTITLKLRVFLSLASSTIKMSAQERSRLKETKALKNSEKGKILVIGNGPSTGQMDIAKIRKFQENGGKISVMNNFWFGELDIEPDFHFITDPAYWSNEAKESEKTGLKLITNYLERNKKCILVQPVNRDPLISNLQRIIFTDARSAAGLFWFDSPIRPQSAPSSVALLSISTAKFLGFSSIYIVGFDTDTYKHFFVTEKNELHYDASTSYFYSQKIPHEKINSFNSGYGVINMKNLPIETISDALFASAVFLRDLRKMNDGRIYNIGNDRTNDAVPRARLEYE
jgi:hypothetical protein